MGGIGLRGTIVSMRFPSIDQGRSTMSERIVTPSPLATIDLTASTEEVRSVTDG
jgi:hypothetical protein